jgi:hypothetical protein
LKRAADPNSPDTGRSHGMSQHPDTRIPTANQTRRVPPPVIKDFDHVRLNIRKHSRGIFDSPVHGRGHNVPSGSLNAFPDLPPRADFARLSHAYLYSLHEMYPVLHWPTFQQEVDQVYTSRSFQGSSQEWIGLFFAVMACGSLQSPQSPAGSPGMENGVSSYYDTAAHTIDPFRQHVSVTQATLTFLLTVFALESNMKSAGAIGLASSVRLVQLLRLDPEADKNTLETEMRRRLWWSIYVLDRYVQTYQRTTRILVDLEFVVSHRSSRAFRC